MILALVLSNGVLAGYAYTLGPECGSSERAMMSAQLFFGRNIGSREGVSDTDFSSFVDEVVTPRFPAGLTRMTATGHWKGKADDAPTRESSEVLTIVTADTPEVRENLELVRRAYMARFRQESVLLTSLRVCARG